MCWKNASSSDVPKGIKGHCSHIRQHRDIFKSQAENQVSLREEGCGAQSSTALPAWQYKLSPRAKSILTPVAEVLLNLIQELRGLPRHFH